MSDDPKTPVTSTFLPMAMTGFGSAVGGDQAADAISQLVAWFMAVHCNCAPPDKVISAVHSLSIIICMALAYTIHYLILKRRES